MIASNNLSGSLPEELCCMPCLEHIDMSDNAIAGDTLTCLNFISTLQTIDFSGNQFGTPAIASTSASSRTNANPP